MAGFQDQLKDADSILVPIGKKDTKRGIHIIADKDTDGILSSVILYAAMKSLGYENVSSDIIPEDQGHTLTEEFLKKIRDDSNQGDIIITADIGIESQGRLKQILDERIRITTDHHWNRYSYANKEFLDQIVDPSVSDEENEHFCGANVDSLLYETIQNFLNRNASEEEIRHSNPLQMFELIAALADRQDPNFRDDLDEECLQNALPRNRQILENAIPMLENLVTQTDPIPAMQPPEANLPLERLGILINKTLDQSYVRDTNGRQCDRIDNNPFRPKAGEHRINDELRMLQRYVAPVLNNIKHIGLGREELIDFFTNPDADIEDDLQKLFDYNEIRSDLSKQWSPRNLKRIAGGTDIDACGMDENWPHPGMRGTIAGPLADKFGHPVTFIGPQEENSKGQRVWRCTTVIPNELDRKTLENLSDILTKEKNDRNPEESLAYDSLRDLLGKARWEDLCKGKKTPKELNGLIIDALKDYAKDQGGFVENNIITIALTDKDLPNYRMQMQSYAPKSQKAEKLVPMTSPTVDKLLPLDQDGKLQLCQQYVDESIRNGSESLTQKRKDKDADRQKQMNQKQKQMNQNDQERQARLKDGYVPVPNELVSKKNNNVYFKDDQGNIYRYNYDPKGAKQPQKDDKYLGQLLIPKDAVFKRKDGKETLSAEQIAEKAQKMIDARKNTIPENVEKTDKNTSEKNINPFDD